MRRTSQSGRYAERSLDGIDDDGASERIVIWLDRREGGLWVVGRSVNPQLRPGDGERPDDVIFSGFELDDALEHANEALEDDVQVLEREGHDDRVAPFTRKEILPALERWFFRS